MRLGPGTSRKRGTALRFGGTILVLAIAAVVITSAQAAPSTKKYEAYVVAANASSTSFTVTLKNNTRSQQTLGSANFIVPTGLTLATFTSTATSTDNHAWNVCSGNGMVCGAGSVVQLRAASNGDALSPGASVSATVSVTNLGTCTSAEWLTFAKQSNNFSGTNNDFARVAADVVPLGSFEWANIGTQTTGTQFTATATAKDTCGNLKSDYSGGYPYTGNSLSELGLTGATISGLTWSGGVGSVKITPAVAEIPNSLTVSDISSGISAESNHFDVVDILCNGTKPCSAKDNPGTTLAGAPDPPSGATLGLGFNKLYDKFACNGVTPIGSFVIIDPSGYGSSLHQVTLTYKKAISGSNPASGFVVCYSKADGAEGSWQIAPNCVSDTTGPAPCVISRKRVSGGDLQVVLLIGGDDPPVGGGFG